MSGKSAPPPTQARISAAISEAGRPLSMREIVLSLDLDRAAARALRALLRDMVKEGLLGRAGRSRYGLPVAARLVRGVMSVARGGYGFVRPESGEAVDVFVPRRELMGALHGDRVAVRVTSERPDGRREGAVLSVIERAHAKVLGIWDTDRGTASSGGWVRPLDTRVRMRVRARSDHPLESGTVVEVKVSRFPDFGDVAEGKVSHVIGPSDDPRLDVAIACRKHGLTETFSEEVQRQVAKIPSAVLTRDLEGREDFRAATIFTIDPETARDFDDAISVSRGPHGGYVLGVHIADVSHYVLEGSPLDLEARRRGTSVYFPGFVVPMLPHPLSSGICSLKPHEDRLVLSVLMEVDDRGSLREARFLRGVIRSRTRFTYPEAQKVLDGDPDSCRRHASLVPSLRLAEELAKLLGMRRRERGSIDFDLPEPEILWDVEGGMAGIVESDRSFTHKLIEEFMLLANEAVAGRLARSGRPTVYRVHERPDPRKLEILDEALRALGLRLDGDFENPTPHMFQRLVARVAGKVEERIVSTLALRSMMLARYDIEALGHFGLAAKLYTHFTSPIRRYPDLVVHRLLWEAVGKVPSRERDLKDICRVSSERERIAQDAEREVIEVKKARFMLERLGEEFDGMVLSVDRSGAWVELVDYLVDGHVSSESLRDDIYEYDARQRCLKGTLRGRRLKIGDRVRVRVDRVDVERRLIDFAVVWPDRAPAAEKPSRKALRGERRLKQREKVATAPPARPQNVGRGLVPRRRKEGTRKASQRRKR